MFALIAKYNAKEPSKEICAIRLSTEIQIQLKDIIRAVSSGKRK